MKDYLAKALASSNHLLSLINDVLDMSRIESGKIHLDEVEVNLSDVLHDLRTIVSGQIYAKQLELYMDVMDVTEEDVYCDKTRLNQILAEPPVQRHQVYPGGRHGLGAGAAAGR